MRSANFTVAAVAAAIVWLLMAVGPASAATTPVRVFLNDRPLALAPSAFEQDGVLYFPLRALAEPFQTAIKVDKDTLEIHRTDGVIFTLRYGRLEIWSEGLVVAVAEAPVILTDGVTMVARGAIETLFEALTVWNQPEHTVVIATRPSFKTEVTTRPTPPPSRTVQASAQEFVPEFHPDLERPLLASGRVTLGLAGGGAAGAQITSRFSFRTHQGEDRINGALSLAAGGEALQTGGTVTMRRPASLIMLGGFSLHDSPLTLHEQALLGVMYAGPVGAYKMKVFGGNIPSSASHVYGFGISFQPIGQWLLGGTFLYDPAAGAFIAKGRAERPLGSGFTLFGEAAAGTAAAGGGMAWRAGVTGTARHLEASVSYLSLATGYPTIGNASLFAGRTGSLVEVTYRPDAPWSLQLNAAVLSGTATDVSDRVTYGAALHYRPSSSVSIVTDVRAIADTAAGVRTRNTTANVAVSYVVGQYGLVLATNHVADTNLTLGSSTGTTTFSLRAGTLLAPGLPLWAEISRQSGSAEAWGISLGAMFRVSTRLDLSAQVRQKTYTVPSVYNESTLEVGMSQPLSNGAQLTVGTGLRYNSSNHATMPYVALQYGYPVYVYGEVKSGRLGGVMFVDTNGNGQMDSGEPPVPGVVVRINDRAAAISNEAGRIAVEGVREGSNLVSVDPNTIPAGLVPVSLQQAVVLSANQTVMLQFPLTPAATLRGVVFLDENGNGVHDTHERAIGGIILALQPGGRYRTVEDDGSFDFADLAPGEYRVVIDKQSLPRGITVKGDGVVVVTVGPGATTMLQIPVLEAIIRTF